MSSEALLDGGGTPKAHKSQEALMSFSRYPIVDFF